ncbi:MAG: isoaspartyl peptidase/L-asparaginase family protein [Planctomycetales bacterium]
MLRLCCFAMLIMTPMLLSAEERRAVPRVVLGIHGGTGLHRSEMTPEEERALRAGLKQALETGYAALNKPDATSLDAVETAIRVLEDNEWFNAGRGAVFTHDGRNELDASIMEGKTRKAGAVANVTIVKNPITAARAVMERTKHVMLIAQGAEKFAVEQKLEIEDPAYFATEKRRRQWEENLREEAEQKAKNKKQGAALPAGSRPHEWSTVGAVAVDKSGNLAAGTSTGGMSNKRYGRVGDSPIIGAGTFADNATCAVSCTGHGEYFIRWAVAHEIASLMRYRQQTVQQAADDVILRQLKEAGGEGAAIALDPQGNFTMSYNSDGLYRGYVTADGKITVRLYEE